MKGCTPGAPRLLPGLGRPVSPLREPSAKRDGNALGSEKKRFDATCVSFLKMSCSTLELYVFFAAEPTMSSFMFSGKPCRF